MRHRSRLSFYLSTVALIALGGAAYAQNATEPNQLEEVNVTGQRLAVENAIKTKEKAEAIVDSVSADDAGHLPDNSVTEVLQRLPGLNMSRIDEGSGSENYTGEGTNITIRGLTEVVSQLNGRDTFSSANGRTLAWEDIPPELMQGVDVWKSESAELPEGGIGGVINLRTRQPFDYNGFTLNASATGNYADYTGIGHPGGSVLISDRWSTKAGEFGLLFNAAYSNLSTRADGVQINPYFPAVYNPTFVPSQATCGAGTTSCLPSLSDAGSKQVFIPGGLSYNQRLDDRQRTGLYGSAQWRPNNDMQFFFTGFTSEYKDQALYHYMLATGGASAPMTLVPGSTTTFDPNGAVLSTNGIGSYQYAVSGAGSGANANSNNQYGTGTQPLPYQFESSLSNSVNRTTDLSTGGDWTVNDNLSVKLAAQHVWSYSNETDTYLYDYAFLPGMSETFPTVGSSALPTVSVPATANLSNPASYAWYAAMDHLRADAGQENALYADGTYEFSERGFVRSVDFGVKITSRTEGDQETNYNWQPLTPWWASPQTFLNQTPQYTTAVNMSSLFNGQTGLPGLAYFPSQSALETPFSQIYQALGAPGNTEQPVKFYPWNLSKMREETEEAYAKINFRDDDQGGWLGPYRGNIGVRLVNYDDHASGYLENAATATTSTFQLQPITAHNEYPVGSGQYPGNVTNFYMPASGAFIEGGHSEFDALPSFNIQFLPNPQTHIRFAASETQSRPSFQQLAPGGFFGGNTVGTYDAFWSGNVGNANLKPETADQLDASIEYYPETGGLFHVSPFYKRINNFLATRQVTVDGTLPTYVGAGGVPPSAGGAVPTVPCSSYAVGTYCPQPISATMVQPFNESQTASVKGVEVGAQKYLDFLPDPFNGIGFDFNYTYLNSTQPGALAYDILGNRINGLPLTGLSNHTINLAFMYDYGPLSLRLAYNWRSAFLITTAAYQTAGVYNYTNLVNYGSGAASQNGKITQFALPLFQTPTGTLDGNMSYRLADNWTWVLEASNLLKTTTQLTMGWGAQTYDRSWYTADRRYLTSLRASF